MEIYTDFAFNIELKEDTGWDVLWILKGLVYNDRIIKPKDLPNHDFFKCASWSSVLGPALEDDEQKRKRRYSSLIYNDGYGICNDEDGSSYRCYLLDSFNSLLNYDNEIEKFLDWIFPSVKPGYQTVAGWYQCETEIKKGTAAQMTTIFWNKDHFELNKVFVQNQDVNQKRN